MKRANFFTLLLVCSTIVPLVVPQANGQTVSTVTSIRSLVSSTTTTGFSTIQMTSTSVQSARFDWTPYGYSEGTGQFMLNQFKESIGGGGRLGAGGDTLPCVYYDYFLLPVTKGNNVRGHIETSKGSPIIFYILNQDQLNGFKHSGCDLASYFGGSQVYAYSDSYDLDFVAPQSGEYVLLFVCPRWYCYDPISISARIYSTNVQTSQAAYTSSLAYTIQNLQTILITQSTTPQQQPPLGDNNYAVAAVIIAVIAVCVGLLVYLRKRRV